MALAPGNGFSRRQAWQYQGAGVFTGLGLRLRHLAQWKRLPFTAVLGRAFFPVLGMFFVIGYYLETVKVRRARYSSPRSHAVPLKTKH